MAVDEQTREALIWAADQRKQQAEQSLLARLMAYVRSVPGQIGAGLKGSLGAGDIRLAGEMFSEGLDEGRPYLFGGQSAQDILLGGMAKQEEAARVPRTGGFAGDVARAVGSSLPSLPTAAIGTAAGGPLLGALLGGLQDAQLEHGNVVADRIRQGEDPREAFDKTRWLAAANLPLSAAQNYLLMRMLPVKGGKFTLRGAGLEAVGEGAQEGAQSTLSQAAVKGEVDPKEALYEGAVGAAVGGLFAGGAGVVNLPAQLKGRKKPPAPGWAKASERSGGYTWEGYAESATEAVDHFLATGDVEALVRTSPAMARDKKGVKYGHTVDGEFVEADGVGPAVAANIQEAEDLGARNLFWLAESRVQGLVNRLPRVMPHLESFLSGRAKTIQAIGGGKIGSAIERALLRPLEKLTLARHRWEDGSKLGILQTLRQVAPDLMPSANPFTRFGRGRFRRLVPRINMPTERAAMPVEELLQQPDIKQVVGGIDPKLQRQVVAMAKAARQYFDAKIAEVNRLRAAQGRKEIGYIENYWPIVTKISAIEDTKRIYTEGQEIPDNVHPTEVEARFAKERSGDLSWALREQDPMRLLDTWTAAMSRDVFNTASILLAKPYAKALREAGKLNSAAALETLLDYSYAGKASPITRASRALFATIPGGAAARGLARHASRSVSMVALALNLKFNLFTQTASGLLVDVRTGVRAATWAKAMMLSSQWRAMADQVYAAKIKRRSGGQVAQQDMESLNTGVSLMDTRASRIGRVIANGITNKIEQWLTRYAALAGYREGKLRGMSDEDAWEFGSDIAAKTQSMYNAEDRPILLNSRDVGLIARFQTFAFEMLNMAREANLGVSKLRADLILGKTGHYQDAAGMGRRGARAELNRAAYVGKFIGVVLLQNWIHEELFGRKLWSPASFIPFGATWVPIEDTGFRQGKTFIFEYYSAMKKAFTETILYSKDPEKINIKPLLDFVTRYYIPGGTQLRRTGQSLQAITKGLPPEVAQALGWAEGGKARIRGKDIMVSVDSSPELIMPLLFGPYHFEAAKARVEELEQKAAAREAKKQAKKEAKKQPLGRKLPGGGRRKPTS